MADGSFIPISDACDKVVIDLESRRKLWSELRGSVAKLSRAPTQDCQKEWTREFHNTQRRELIQRALEEMHKAEGKMAVLEFLEGTMVAFSGGATP